MFNLQYIKQVYMCISYYAQNMRNIMGSTTVGLILGLVGLLSAVLTLETSSITALLNAIIGVSLIGITIVDDRYGKLKEQLDRIENLQSNSEINKL